MVKLAANLSLMFTEVDFLDRFAKAARAGFEGVGLVRREVSYALCLLIVA